MSLTGLPLIIVLAVLTAGFPIGLAVWSVGRPVRARLGSRVGATVLRIFGVLGCQLVMVALVFSVVNRGYGFYASWGDLLGTSHRPAQVDTGPPPNVGPTNRNGKLVSLTVHGRVSLTTAPVLVWLPPQYFQASQRHHHFPVLMVLTGYPSTPTTVFKGLDVASQSVRAMKDDHVAPFIAVLPPITIRPGLDTECVNFPGGPLAESWLTRDVASAVRKKFRVSDHGFQWALAGISAGAYCATNVYLHHRQEFGSAVSLGGYFTAAFDRPATPQLGAAERKLAAQNSPLAMFTHHPPASANLLLISSRQDRGSWHGLSYADGEQMFAVARHVRGVTEVILPAGGHNYRTYGPMMPMTLEWLGRHGI